MSVRARGGGFDSRSAILYLSPLRRRDCYVRAFEMFGNGVDRRRGGVESARIRKSAQRGRRRSRLGRGILDPPLPQFKFRITPTGVEGGRLWSAQNIQFNAHRVG